ASELYLFSVLSVVYALCVNKQRTVECVSDCGPAVGPGQLWSLTSAPGLSFKLQPTHCSHYHQQVVAHGKTQAIALSLSLCMSVCLCVCVSVCLSVCLSVYVSACLSFCLSV